MSAGRWSRARASGGMKRALRLGLLLGAAALAAGSLVVASGIIPIKASSGHWAITAWLLDFAKRRSVSLHARSIGPLSFDESGLLERGAGHFESGCRPCHGAPGHPPSRVGLAMTPHPPALVPIIRSRTPEELFYVVKHGIKFTGMPAWPVLHRDDEVRAVVAFLIRLPELDAGGYAALVEGPAPPDAPGAPLADFNESFDSARAALASSCARCHGYDGVRHPQAFPRLAGQREAYLLNSLRAFANRQRASGIMQPVAVGLEDAEMQALARYYASLPPGAPAEPPGADSADAIRRGAEIATVGIPSADVPACNDCHGPREGPINPAYPSLAGLSAGYLETQLRLFRAGRRGGSEYAPLMRHVAIRIPEEELRNLVLYYASLDPRRSR